MRDEIDNFVKIKVQALKNNKALQKKYGITVRADEKAGAYTLVSSDGKSTLSFKF